MKRGCSMISSKLKNIYSLVEKLQLKNYEEEYKKLLKLDNSIGSFHDYITKYKKQNNALDSVSELHNDLIIFRDTIKKENVIFNLYLISFNHTDFPELDGNYKPLPLKEKCIYEYGTYITFEESEGEYTIENAFSGIEDTKEKAERKYETLKKQINELSLEEVIERLEKSVLEQLNVK